MRARDTVVFRRGRRTGRIEAGLWAVGFVIGWQLYRWAVAT